MSILLFVCIWWEGQTQAV